jgi:hypothetical protein
MLEILIVGFCFIIGILYITRTKEEGISIIFPIGLVIIAGMVVLVFSFLGSSLPHKVGTVQQTYELIALSDNSLVHGSSFLGTGTIDEVQYYIYYYNDSTGIHQGKVKVSNTTLHYWTSNNSGKLEVVPVEPSSKWEYLLTFPSWEPQNEIYIPGEVSLLVLIWT